MGHRRPWCGVLVVLTCLISLSIKDEWILWAHTNLAFTSPLHQNMFLFHDHPITLLHTNQRHSLFSVVFLTGGHFLFLEMLSSSGSRTPHKFYFPTISMADPTQFPLPISFHLLMHLRSLVFQPPVFPSYIYSTGGLTSLMSLKSPLITNICLQPWHSPTVGWPVSLNSQRYSWQRALFSWYSRWKDILS
jgi:hypothetical protein